jgi:hypothetical protein
MPRTSRQRPVLLLPPAIAVLDSTRLFDELVTLARSSRAFHFQPVCHNTENKIRDESANRRRFVRERR